MRPASKALIEVIESRNKDVFGMTFKEIQKQRAKDKKQIAEKNKMLQQLLAEKEKQDKFLMDTILRLNKEVKMDAKRIAQLLGFSVAFVNKVLKKTTNNES